MSKRKEIIRDLKELKALHVASANVATRLITALEEGVRKGSTSSTRKGFDEARIAADFTRKLLKAR